MIRTLIFTMIVLATLNMTILEGQLSLGFFLCLAGGWLLMDLMWEALSEWKAGRMRVFGRRNYSGKMLPKDWYK